MSRQELQAEIVAGAKRAIETWSQNAGDRSLLVGFDGFVDEIIGIVDQRHSMADDDFDLIESITAFADRAARAAGRSTNMELVVREERFGGNGPLLAGAAAMLGLGTTFIGAIGANDDPTRVHPLFKGFADRCADVIPIAAPARTEALEFNDGKIMLSRPANVQTVTWDRILQVVGLDRVLSLVGESDSLAIVNWSLLGGVGGIWEGLCRDVLEPRVSAGERVPSLAFIDLSDPAKRTDADIRGAITQLGRLNRSVPVTLGVNLAESQRLAGLFGTEGGRTDMPTGANAAMLPAVERLRAALELDTLVVHAHAGAGAASDSGETAWVDAAYTERPKISTGAGDHFSGGFVFARTNGATLAESLAIGCATAGAYVRDAVSPSLVRVLELLDVMRG